MIIFPAIDIRNGKCVRLFKGKFDQETIYSDNPLDMAFDWQLQGAQYLHVVDLDGARIGKPVNYDTIRMIINLLDIPVQVGGGIRSIETANKYLSAGAKRVIMGTSAVADEEMVKQAATELGEKLVIGLDCKNGFVAVNGWEETSSNDYFDFSKKLEQFGVKNIIYTDISRDGTLEGPNLLGIQSLVNHADIDVIASGGVASIQDIISIKQTGVAGVIIGKALYNGSVTMREALQVNL